MKTLNEIFMRADKFATPCSHEIANNDLKDFAIYKRIENSVIRIHEIDNTKGQVIFNIVTSPDLMVSADMLQNTLLELLSTYNDKNYKIIRGY
jgi:hypothetical protein